MKKCIVVFFFFAAFFTVAVFSFKSVNEANCSPLIPVTDYNFDCTAGNNVNVIFGLKGQRLVSLSCEGKELNNYEYCYNCQEGVLTLYKSYLLSLEGLNVFTVETENNSAQFTVNVLRPCADYDADFGDVQGNGGWYYMMDDPAYGVSGNAKEAVFFNNVWMLDINPNYKFSPSQNTLCSQKSLLLKWVPPYSGVFNVNCDIIKKQASDSVAIYAVIYKNSEEIKNIYIPHSDYISSNFTKNFRQNITLNASDCLYFDVMAFGDTGNDFDYDITISYPQKQVEFYVEGQPYRRQLIPYGNKAVLPETTMEKNHEVFKCWQTENGTEYDFDNAVTQDIKLYAQFETIEERYGDITIDKVSDKYYLNITQKENCLYQFWAMTEIVSDGNESNLSNTGSIWTLLQPYSPSASAELPNCLVTEQKELRVLVRIIIGEKAIQIHKCFDTADINKDKISSFFINGNFCTDGVYSVKKSNTLAVTVCGASGLDYYLYCGGEELSFSSSGLFDIDLTSLKCGYNDFNIVAYREGEECDSVNFRAYIYDDYDNSTPVFYDFSGMTYDNGYTEYTVKIKCANRRNISPEVLNDLNISLYSESTPLQLKDSFFDGDGVYTLCFIAEYGNKHGIYKISGKICKKGQNYCDNLLTYYYGYTRTAELYQTADKYTCTAEESINILACGTITQEDDGLLYAFFKEDADGWKMIRDYSECNSLKWQPLKAGVYIIQARIMGRGEGSYEKTATIEYVVTGSRILSSCIDFFITDAETDQIVNTITPGKPYYLNAVIPDENVLYKFTSYNSITGLIYLNKYSVSGKIIFIAEKPGIFTLSARAISLNNYGYRDIYQSITVNSIIE